jgi:hypothetical protein
MPEVKLDAADARRTRRNAAIPHRMAGARPQRLGAWLAEFAGHPVYGITQLRDDLERFVFVLGGSGGEPSLGHDRWPASPPRPAYRLSQVTGPKLAGATGGGMSLRPLSIPRKVLASITNDE